MHATSTSNETSRADTHSLARADTHSLAWADTHSLLCLRMLVYTYRHMHTRAISGSKATTGIDMCTRVYLDVCTCAYTNKTESLALRTRQLSLLCHPQLNAPWQDPACMCVRMYVYLCISRFLIAIVEASHDQWTASHDQWTALHHHVMTSSFVCVHECMATSVIQCGTMFFFLHMLSVCQWIHMRTCQTHAAIKHASVECVAE